MKRFRRLNKNAYRLERRVSSVQVGEESTTFVYLSKLVWNGTPVLMVWKKKFGIGVQKGVSTLARKFHMIVLLSDDSPRRRVTLSQILENPFHSSTLRCVQN